MVIHKISFLSIFILLGILFEFCGAQDCCLGDKCSPCINERSQAPADDQPEHKSKVRFGDKVKIFWKGILCGILIVVGGAGYYFFYKKREGNGFFGFFISKKKSRVTIPPKEFDVGTHPELHKESDRDIQLEQDKKTDVDTHFEVHKESGLAAFSQMYTNILLVEHNVIRAEEMRSMLKNVQATAVLCCHNYDSETIQLDAFYACVSCS